MVGITTAGDRVRTSEGPEPWAEGAVGKSALGTVGTEAAGDGVICLDGCGIFIGDDGFLVVMEGVDCTAGDVDAKVGVLVMRFFIFPIVPCPVGVVGLLAPGKGGRPIPFEGRAAEGMIASGVTRGLNEGDWAIP